MRFLFHPPVVHFPIALWLTSALFDILYLRTADRFYFRASQILIGLGLIGALVAIAVGFYDFLSLKPEDVGPAFIRRHRVHSFLAYAATITYGASFFLRWRRPATGRAWMVLLLIAGVVLISITGFLGGELRRVM